MTYILAWLWFIYFCAPDYGVVWVNQTAAPHPGEESGDSCRHVARAVWVDVCATSGGDPAV